ncbi:MAG: hypothetical protein U0840_26615 [Gemmataceae bacterium]
MSVLVTLTLLLAGPGPCEPLGTLWNRQEPWVCGGGTPYHPQEGDLVFFTSTSPLFGIVFGVGRTSHPYHVGMVVRDRSGQLVIFEAGGTQEYLVVLKPIVERMTDYVTKRSYRRIWVRRIREPLTPEQSLCLTQFAHAQEGKSFACCFRMAAHALPGRPLIPTHPNQHGWFCAELVSETMRVMGLCSAGHMVPHKTTPRDLFYDRRDISCGWHAPETWSADELPPRAGPLCAPR